MKLTSPCYGCDRRTVEPNCHNQNICSEWAEFTAMVEEDRETVRKNRSNYYSGIGQTKASIERMKKRKNAR